MISASSSKPRATVGVVRQVAVNELDGDLAVEVQILADENGPQSAFGVEHQWASFDSYCTLPVSVTIGLVPSETFVHLLQRVDPPLDFVAQSEDDRHTTHRHSPASHARVRLPMRPAGRRSASRAS